MVSFGPFVFKNAVAGKNHEAIRLWFSRVRHIQCPCRFASGCLVKFQPDIIVNAAAYQRKIRPENGYRNAYSVDATGLELFARRLLSLDIPFYHVSY